MYDKLLICVTGSPNSMDVVRVGLAVASRNAQVIFLHVEPRLDDAVRKRVDKELSHIRTIMLEKPPVRSEFVLLEGDAKEKIIELANKNEVAAIIVGEAKGHGGESVSDFLLHNAKAAVLSVKGKEA